MTPYAQQTAARVLDDAIPMIESAPGQVAWSYIKALIHQILENPILASFVADLPWDDPARHVRNSDRIPADPAAWGRMAWAELRFHYERGTGGIQGTAVAQIVAGNSDNSGQKLRYAMSLAVIPLVRWLRAELEQGPLLHHTLERWVQRTTWLGLDRGPWLNDDTRRLIIDLAEAAELPVPRAFDQDHTRLVESHFQADLHRFLFDSGIEFRDQGREHHTAKGRVDFLLRTDEPVAVELKVWRDTTSFGALRAWATQALRYPADLGIKSAYLVIANVSEKKRLEPAPALWAPGVLRHGEIDLHVRVVDLGAKAPSREQRERKAVVVDRAALLGS